MTDVLIYADTMRSPELRHEVPVPIPDPLLYLEHDGRRVVVVSSLETARIGEAAPEIEAIPLEHLGYDELVQSGKPLDEVLRELYTRACREVGVASAAVPPSFPLELADHLRAIGIEVAVDRGLFEDRRRRGSAASRSKAAPGAARVCGARRRPRDAPQVDPQRRSSSTASATSERVKHEIERVFGEHDVTAEHLIVAHGAQTAIGHDEGSGAFLPDEPIVFDLFPRDRATGVYTDMTRTYVVGTPSEEVQEFHRLAKEALERVVAEVKPGVNGRALMELVCDFFDGHGYPTQLTKEPGQVLEDGFFHGLGHGVGLEVHERPWMSRVGDDLVAGDVIAIEPGLYRSGYGGVRLEDIAIVTDDGIEVVTDYPYDLQP
jgi:Xaa-Pro aminopeptidase